MCFYCLSSLIFPNHDNFEKFTIKHNSLFQLCKSTVLTIQLSCWYIFTLVYYINVIIKVLVFPSDCSCVPRTATLFLPNEINVSILNKHIHNSIGEAMLYHVHNTRWSAWAQNAWHIQLRYSFKQHLACWTVYLDGRVLNQCLAKLAWSLPYLKFSV